MKKLSTNEIRKVWLDFFAEKGHHIEESKSLVPVNDKSLLFINSGVATLKKYFDGTEVPPSQRITNSQKSIRTNDIENVGLTSRHHTLFEMLGNFSIGDYFKEEAIEWGWEILTDEKYFAFEKDKLYITVHPEDNETKEKWISLGVDPRHIVALEENFWEHGAGPGGPNTEIFYDRGVEYDDRDVIGLLAEDLENDRIIEIWNIVFSQYNCDPEIPRKDYKELPQKNIDTGMGLERMACVMQEVETNFETDNFAIIIEALVNKTGIAYDDKKMAYRVIADHVRALTFAIADGALPSNEGRGYVIRRILRRGVKYGYKDLKLNKPFMYELVDNVIEVMEEFYPYLRENEKFIKEVIEIEEEKFFQTIEEGIVLLDKAKEASEGNEISGDVAFKLYDTFGFPIELTVELAEETNYIVDMDGFESALEEQRARARAAQNNDGGMSKQNTFAKSIEVTSTFVGYDTLSVETKIKFITDLEASYQVSSSEEKVWVVLDKTPFYAESGGQVGDTGTLNDIEVLNTIKLPNGQHAHQICGEVKVGEEVVATVNETRRAQITKNHSATHLLHKALHELVGSHAKQAGSLQDEFKTRFDFTALKKIDNETLMAIEKNVNAAIKANNKVDIQEMSIEEARNKGANALFGEKYGDVVRVVTIGDAIELCGGTHVKNSLDIETFHILSESGIGSGVRRIEAITGDLVPKYGEDLINSINNEIAQIQSAINKKQIVGTKELFNLAQKLERLIPTYNNNYTEVLNKIEQLNNDLEELKETLKKEEANASANLASELMNNVVEKDGVKFIEAIITDIPMKELRNLSDDLLARLESGVVILEHHDGNKASVIVKVSEDQAKTNPANQLLKSIIEPKNGRGGGKPTMAQGGYNL